MNGYSVIVILTITLWMWSCNNPFKEPALPIGQIVIDSSLSVSKLHLLQKAKASFVFRDRTYGYSMNEGVFEYTRFQTDSAGNEILDVLTNDGLVRYWNNRPVELDEKKTNAYSNSVNSVVYFAFLPYRLNDPAVRKEYVGTAKIRDRNYHKIKVTFNEDRGGEDFQDVFYYWFHETQYTMDYMAYEYFTDGGGLRFRVATNVREVAGVIVQDYINYEPKKDAIVTIDKIDESFNRNELEILSEIRLEDISIQLTHSPKS